MAITIKSRGKKFTFIYYYFDEQGVSLQQYEAYDTLNEAEQRARVIEFLRENKDHSTLRKLANEYNDEKNGKKRAHNSKSENMKKTFSEFIWMWVPRHARKVRMKPAPYSQMKANIKNHIEPFFGDMIVSKITAEDIDEWVHKMSLKKCKGPKSYNKQEEDVPTLRGSTIMKSFNVISPAFRDAEAWGYTNKCPVSKDQAPTIRYEKRKYWTKEQMLFAIDSIIDPLLHLAVHLAFICSLRPGETVGMDISSIALPNRSLWVKQTLQRVEEDALNEVSQEDIIKVFPKKKKDAKSVLILKKPKTDESERTGFLNSYLQDEISQRMVQIERDKEYFGAEYHDYGLLLCWPNGDPIEPRRMDSNFKKWQMEQGFEENDTIDMQGVRKSATMYKLRLTNYDLQSVSGETGHTSAATMLDHYDEVMETDRRKLSALVEGDFYGKGEASNNESDFSMMKLFEQLSRAPELASQIYESLNNMPALQ